MSRVLTNEQYYYDIAATIRQMKNVNTTYKPREMASALKDIYSNEVEGTLPLSFEANGNNLLDYRIDGASGGVGDRTGNLFNGSWENKFIDTYGNTGYSTNRVLSSYVTVIPNQTYSVKSNMRIRAVHSFNGATHTQTLIDNVAGLDGATFTIPADSNSIRISLKKANDGDFTPDDVDWCMLNIGSQPLPNEPYGYKVPVVMNGKNLFDELQVVDTTVSTEMSNYQIFKNNGKLLINGLTTSSQSDVEIANINSINNQALQFINSNEAQYIFSAEVPGRIMIRYKLLGSDVVRYTFDEYNSSNRVADRIVFRLQQNYQYNNEQMNIMFKLKQIQSDNYEEYHEQTITNIYLDNPIRTVEDEVEYIDYSEQKQHRVRKNLLQNTATTQTINGVNVIVNNDGSIKLSGTSTAITYIDINSNFNSTEFQNCYLNPFYPNNFVSSASTVLLRISNTTNRNSIQDFLNNSVIRDNGSNLRLAIRIGQNYTFSNDFVISPMISKFSDNTYEPYIENTEVDVTLPAIPTLDGTNTLSIGTTVQPSNVYVQAPKDSIEAIQIANELEEI